MRNLLLTVGHCQQDCFGLGADLERAVPCESWSKRDMQPVASLQQIAASLRRTLRSSARLHTRTWSEVLGNKKVTRLNCCPDT